MGAFFYLLTNPNVLRFNYTASNLGRCKMSREGEGTKHTNTAKGKLAEYISSKSGYVNSTSSTYIQLMDEVLKETVEELLTNNKDTVKLLYEEIGVTGGDLKNLGQIRSPYDSGKYTSFGEPTLLQSILKNPEAAIKLSRMFYDLEKWNNTEDFLLLSENITNLERIEDTDSSLLYTIFNDFYKINDKNFFALDAIFKNIDSFIKIIEKDKSLAIPLLALGKADPFAQALGLLLQDPDYVISHKNNIGDFAALAKQDSNVSVLKELFKVRHNADINFTLEQENNGLLKQLMKLDINSAKNLITKHIEEGKIGPEYKKGVAVGFAATITGIGDVGEIMDPYLNRKDVAALAKVSKPIAQKAESFRDAEIARQQSAENKGKSIEK